MVRVIIVEDDIKFSGLLKQMLGDGHDSCCVTSAEVAWDEMNRCAYDLCLLDYQLPGMDGLSLLEKMSGLTNAPAVLFMSAQGSLDLALQAIRLGAADFLAKPFNGTQLLTLVERVLSKQKKSPAPPPPELKKWETLFGHLSANSPMHDLIENADVIAAQPSNTPVLINGETGTGKGRLARAIHQLGVRNQKPFIELNCAAMPAALIESQLFGHEAGAFTDAKDLRQGCFEQADGGVLFLDEVAELSLEAQVKLLKILEEQTFYRVGGIKQIKVDVMVIAATHCNLQAAVADGCFRDDLYYRLQVLTLGLPALRERRQDILDLAKLLLLEIVKKTGKTVSGFDHSFLDWLQVYDFPGNVRELRNVIEREVIFHKGEGPLVLRTGFALVPSTAAPSIQLQDTGASADYAALKVELKQIEKSFVQKIVSDHGGNVSRTAKAMGVGRIVLRNLLKKYQISAKDA